jgi:hypothetical protein
MDCAIAVVIVADRAVKQMITENSIERLALCRLGAHRIGDDIHAVCSNGAASSHKLSIHFNHTGIASLHSTQLGMIANLRQGYTASVDCIDKAFTSPDGLHLAVYRNCHGLAPFQMSLDTNTGNASA